MPNSYVIYNADGSYQNCIYCEETDTIPDEFTRVLIPEGSYFNGTEIVQAGAKIIELKTF